MAGITTAISMFGPYFIKTKLNVLDIIIGDGDYSYSPRFIAGSIGVNQKSARFLYPIINLKIAYLWF